LNNTQGILNDHQHLDGLLRDLRVVSGWNPALFLEPSVRARLLRDLGALHARLVSHFAIEERGSYLAEIGQRRPAARPKLEKLHAEHRALLDQVEGVLNLCNASPLEGKFDRFDFQRNLLALLNALHEHERQETLLIQEVFRAP